MKKLLSWKVIMLCVAVALFGAACEDSDDDDSDASASGSSASTLANGTVAVNAGGPAVNPTNVTAPDDGRIVAVMDWGETGNLTAYFKKSDPANYGWVQGQSPLTSTIDNVSSNDTYTFYMVNNGATNYNVSYTITFEPSE